MLLSGYPLLSMAQVAVGYPLTWGYLFLPGHWAEQVYVLAPYLLSPIFTYAYARELGRSRIASMLAGLSFGYGGMILSGIGLNGLMPNAVMWLPLFLIAIERARTRRFIPCLLSGAAAYTMSVLAGVGQGFVYAGTLALAYGVFLVLHPRRPNEQPEAETEEQGDWRKWRPLIVLSGLAVVAHAELWTWRRLKPLAVAAGGIALASGVAAFQVLETLRAASLSVRGVLSYEQFSFGYFPLDLAFKAWLQPPYPYGDVTLYVSPLATGLAIAVFCLSLRQWRRNPLVLFWAAVAVISFIMILGPDTRLNQIFYNIPFINRFRIPSRHSFEWTFALSILGAFGWDAMKSLIAGRRETASAWRERYGIVLGIVCLAAGAAVGFSWWRFSSNPINDVSASPAIFQYPYLAWKAAFTLLIFASAGLLWRMKSGRLQVGLLAGVVTLACFIEPFITITRWFPGMVVPASRFGAFAPTTEFLRQYPPEQNRVYSSINPFAESQAEKPTLDSVNITALAGIHHVAGYEPLMQERYSRALNNLPWDIVPRDASLGTDPTLFEPKSHVLDLLNTTFAIVYSDADVSKDGVDFRSDNLGVDVKSDSPIILSSEDAEGDTLALVTTLGNAPDIPQEAVVARIAIRASDGRVIERELRAGVDTSELAYDRPDAKSIIKHALAPIFDSSPLYDSASGRSAPLSTASKNWRTVYRKDGVKILQNTRALPRAWLVTSALAVVAEEAWATIRGLNDRQFDPRRTALLEIDPRKIPTLSGRPLSDDSYARIVNYEPNRLTIETKTDQPALLVVSEMHYPGWIAKIDGVKTSIHTTNFLLRGVVTPAGLHRVEMRYNAPKARTGAIISLFTLLLVASLAVYAKRRATKR